FDNVEDYLHHRPPYLLVQQIIEIKDHAIHAQTRLTGEEYFFTGHFPGAPILPGAMMQEMTTQTAGILIAARHNPMPKFDTHDPFFNEYALGVLVKVTSAKYRGFARPGDCLNIRVTLNEIISSVFDFSAEITVGDRRIVRNAFQLTNIKSDVLQGKKAGVE
ncbi:MAG: hypothetical protein AAFN70_17010, partial [Planctomycetota bacterium]